MKRGDIYFAVLDPGIGKEVRKRRPVVIVSRSFAQKYWSLDSALGQRLRLPNDPRWWTVVGIVGDVREFGLDNAIRPTIRTKPRVTMATVTMSGHGMPKPGISVSINISAPTANAMTPPTPSEPYDGKNTSPTMNAIPTTINARPA